MRERDLPLSVTGRLGVLAGDGGSIPFGGGGGQNRSARHAAAGRRTRIWRPTLWGQAPDTIWLVARNLHRVSAPMVFELLDDGLRLVPEGRGVSSVGISVGTTGRFPISY